MTPGHKTTKCCVEGCGSRFLKMFRIPNIKKGVDRHQKFVSATGNLRVMGLPPSKRGDARICLRHFRDIDVSVGGRLKDFAIPTLFLPHNRDETSEDGPAVPNFSREWSNEQNNIDLPLPDSEQKKSVDIGFSLPILSEDLSRIPEGFSNPEKNTDAEDNDVSEVTTTEADVDGPFRLTDNDLEFESLETLPVFSRRYSFELKEKEPLIHERCAVKGCPNVKFNRDVRYFTFPYNQDLARKWKKLSANPALNELTLLQIVKGYSVCCLHFEDNQFENLEKKKLLANQVPKINLPSQKSDQLLIVLEGINSDDERLVHRPFLGPDDEVKEEIPSDNECNEADLSFRNDGEPTELNKNEPIPQITYELVSPIEQKIKISEPAKKIKYKPASQIKKRAILEVKNYGEQERNPGYIFSSVKVCTADGPVEMCRTCLKPLGTERQLICDDRRNGTSVSLLHCVKVVLPELNLNVYPKAYVCKQCASSLRYCYELEKTWLDAELTLKKYILKNINKVASFSQPTDVKLPGKREEKTTEKPTNQSSVNADHDYCNSSGKIHEIPDDNVVMDCNDDDGGLDTFREEENANVSDNVQVSENQVKQLYVPNDNSCSSKINSRNKWGILASEIYSETNNIFDSRLEECFQWRTGVFYFKRRLRKLAKANCGDPPYLCEICGAMFDKLEAHKRHVNHHRNIKNRVPIFTCEICGVTLENADVRAHYRAAHLQRRFTCNICNRKFLFAHLLEYHTRAKHRNPKHIEKLQCHICGVKLSHNSMKYHILSHNPDKKNVECPICGKKFFYPKSLRRHIQCHSDVLWSCHICGKKLKYQNSLERHIRFKHLKQGDNICTVCNKLFWSKSKLKKHYQRMHGAENSSEKEKMPKREGYKCPYCGKILMYQTSLKGHINNVHLNKGYECVICDKILSRKNKLRDHYINVHKMPQEEVDNYLSSNFGEHSKDNLSQQGEINSEEHCEENVTEQNIDDESGEIDEHSDREGNEYSELSDNNYLDEDEDEYQVADEVEYQDAEEVEYQDAEEVEYQDAEEVEYQVAEEVEYQVAEEVEYQVADEVEYQDADEYLDEDQERNDFEQTNNLQERTTQNVEGDGEFSVENTIQYKYQL